MLAKMIVLIKTHNKLEMQGNVRGLIIYQKVEHKYKELSPGQVQSGDGGSLILSSISS